MCVQASVRHVCHTWHICVARVMQKCAHGLLKGAAVGWVDMCLQCHVSEGVPLPACVRCVGKGAGALCGLPQHRKDCRVLGKGQTCSGRRGKSDVWADPRTGLPPSSMAACRTALSVGRPPHSRRENQRLQELHFPDSCFGLPAYSWLLDRISEESCLWLPWLLREKACHGLVIRDFLGPNFIPRKKRERITLPSN